MDLQQKQQNVQFKDEDLSSQLAKFEERLKLCEARGSDAQAHRARAAAAALAPWPSGCNDLLGGTQQPGEQ